MAYTSHVRKVHYCIFSLLFIKITIKIKMAKYPQLPALLIGPELRAIAFPHCRNSGGELPLFSLLENSLACKDFKSCISLHI